MITNRWADPSEPSTSPPPFPPSSGGVLADDWKTLHQHKLDIIASAHPNPTRWQLSGTEVTPTPPAPEETGVASEVDTSAFSAPTAAAAAATAPAPAACGAAAAAGAGAAPNGTLVFESEMLAVYEVNGWVDGEGAQCTQYEIKVRWEGEGGEGRGEGAGGPEGLKQADDRRGSGRSRGRGRGRGGTGAERGAGF